MTALAPWLIVLACGVGTWLMRVGPLRGGGAWAQRPGEAPTALRGVLGRLMAAVGPAALAAMLVATLAPFSPWEWAWTATWPFTWTSAWPFTWLPQRTPLAVGALAGVAATVAVQRWRGGLALPTLAGALVYAVMLAAMTSLPRGPGAP